MDNITDGLTALKDGNYVLNKLYTELSINKSILDNLENGNNFPRDFKNEAIINCIDCIEQLEYAIAILEKYPDGAYTKKNTG